MSKRIWQNGAVDHPFRNSARAEINDILAFIALDNPAAAAKFAAKIQ
jgi:plasmid stabilization system protein ParE